MVGVGQSIAAVAVILGVRARRLSAAQAAPVRDQDLTKCGSAKPDLTTFLLLGRKNPLTH